uniref:Malate dehydrogenase n=1 Tax=Panagrolaimus sp. JU765 TaxID=591449 RepID=A0AC34QGA1_9BILA
MDRGNDFHFVVPFSEMHEFIVRCVTTAGCVPEQADSVGRMLLDADSRGHYSHGVNRLSVYVRDLQTHTCKPDGKPKVTKKKGSTALVDGDNALGSVVGEFCMNLAIDLAKEHGIGWVAAHNSNHFGTAGRYAKMASDVGFIGMAFTNTSPCLFPTRSAQKALGTNPISFFAPINKDDKFALDMATSTVAYGKVEFAKRKGKEHVPISWGADRNGIMTTNPDEILHEGGLLPLGGIEETSGYKGTGLCQMVEILCGVLSGATFGKNVREWQGVAKHADL